jgi:hypothetical protein
VILDRDAKFAATVMTFLKATGLKPKRTSIQSPWQNGTAERWVGSCRREILDHVIAINERHLLRLWRDYVSYYHQDRIHDSLEKDTPVPAGNRAKAGREREGDVDAASRRPAPSLHMAPSGAKACRNAWLSSCPCDRISDHATHRAPDPTHRSFADLHARGSVRASQNTSPVTDALFHVAATTDRISAGSRHITSQPARTKFWLRTGHGSPLLRPVPPVADVVSDTACSDTALTRRRKRDKQI